MEQKQIETSLERVCRMEAYLDEILLVMETDPEQFWGAGLQERLNALSEYYSGGLWLEDYDRDCAGEFPKDLKRGVLGQDTLYDLFEELKQFGILAGETPEK